MLNENEQQSIVDTAPEWFERQVLALMMRSRQAYQEYAGKINRGPGGEYTTDFGNQARNLLMNYIHRFRTDMAKVEEVDPAFIRAIVEVDVAQDNILPTDRTAIHEELNHITDVHAETSAIIVKASFTEWIDKSRTRQLLNNQPRNKGADISRWIERLSLHHRQLHTDEGAEKYENMVELIQNPPVEPERRLHFGMMEVDNLMLGGLGLGESMLVVAPQSAGKTVFALQAVSSYVYNCGAYGVFVTTEQKMSELWGRVVSQRLNIPFERLARGFTKEAVPPDKMEDVVELAKLWQRHVVSVNWNSNQSLGIVGGIDAELDEAERRLGRKPEFIVFDWIGRGLGSINSKDFGFMRHFFQQAADYMANIARERNIASVLMTQANVDKTRRTKRIGPEHIAECKGMGQNQTWGLGISALPTEEDAENPDKNQVESFQRNQVFNFFKARKSGGGVVRVLRQFKYQRFEEANARNVTTVTRKFKK